MQRSPACLPKSAQLRRLYCTPAHIMLVRQSLDFRSAECTSCSSYPSYDEIRSSMSTAMAAAARRIRSVAVLLARDGRAPLSHREPRPLSLSLTSRKNLTRQVKWT